MLRSAEGPNSGYRLRSRIRCLRRRHRAKRIVSGLPIRLTAAVRAAPPRDDGYRRSEGTVKKERDGRTRAACAKPIGSLYRCMTRMEPKERQSGRRREGKRLRKKKGGGQIHSMMAQTYSCKNDRPL